MGERARAQALTSRELLKIDMSRKRNVKGNN